MTLKGKYFSFSLIVIANVVLKGIYCDYSPYGYDEIISVKDTVLDFGHIKHESEWDNNPPFYYYCLWVWHRLIPVSEFNSRLLSIIFVSLAIGLTFLFSQKYFGQKVGIITAVLLSISNFITYYSQETRVYSLILLLALLSSLQFFRYLERGTIKDLLLISLINFLVVYSHYIAGIILLAQYTLVVLFYKPKIKSFLVGSSLIIFFLVFLRFTKKQFLNIVGYNNKGDFWLQKSTLDDLGKAIGDLFINPLTAYFFIIVVFLYLFRLKDNKRNPKFVYEIYCLLLGFISICFLFGIGVFKALFLGRYLIFCIPFATTFVVWRMIELSRTSIYIFAILITYSFSKINLKKQSGMDYRSIASVVKQCKKESDMVVVNKRDNALLFLFYFNKDLFLKYKNNDSICNSNGIYGINDTLQLSWLQVKKGTTLFLAQSFHKMNNNENAVKDFLAKRMLAIYNTSTFKGVEFSVFRKPD